MTTFQPPSHHYHDDLELARLLGALYTEVFQRTVKEDNKPISQSTHNQDRMTIDEDVFGILVTASNTTLWGVAGVSHHLSLTGIQGVWSEGGSYG
jgi:hypothetical protein